MLFMYYSIAPVQAAILHRDKLKAVQDLLLLELK